MPQFFLILCAAKVLLTLIYITAKVFQQLKDNLNDVSEHCMFRYTRFEIK